MDNIEYTLTSSVRFICIDKSYLNNIKDTILKKTNFELGKYFDDKTKNVLVIELDDGLNDEIIFSIIKNKDKFKSHDFFISVTSDSQCLIVDIPDRVLQLREKIGGAISFSYSCF